MLFYPRLRAVIGNIIGKMSRWFGGVLKKEALAYFSRLLAEMSSKFSRNVAGRQAGVLAVAVLIRVIGFSNFFSVYQSKV